MSTFRAVDKVLILGVLKLTGMGAYIKTIARVGDDSVDANI